MKEKIEADSNLNQNNQLLLQGLDLLLALKLSWIPENKKKRLVLFLFLILV